MSTLTDTQAVNWIARMLRAPEWDSAPDYLQEIAAVVSDTGRDLEHPPNCDGCGAEPSAGCTEDHGDACDCSDCFRLVNGHELVDHSMAKEDRRNAGIQ